MLKNLYLETTLTSLRFAAKHFSISQFFGVSFSYAQLEVLHIPNSAEENCLRKKSKTHNMSEKRYKINKFANDQNMIVRNSPAFDHHVFVSSQDRWSMDFDVMRMISTQIRWQDPCWSLCKLWEHSLDFIEENVWEVASPTPPPPRVKHTNTLINFLGTRSWDGFWHLIEDVL